MPPSPRWRSGPANPDGTLRFGKLGDIRRRIFHAQSDPAVLDLASARVQAENGSASVGAGVTVARATSGSTKTSWWK
ncbi:MAG: hypothetical protein ACXWJO_09715, partial [Xanthobacteraceae bacterium]